MSEEEEEIMEENGRESPERWKKMRQEQNFVLSKMMAGNIGKIE
jgi:hypothetical protein